MIKQLSYVLITVGTIGASICAARTQPEIEGWQNMWQIQTPAFVGFLIMMIIGILFSKLRTNPLLELTQEESKPPLDDYLNSAKLKLNELSNSLATMNTHDIYKQLDTITDKHIEPFLSQREFIIEQYGMAQYAVIFTPYAQAERYLNRAWSAAVDGYKDESAEYIKRSIPLLTESVNLLKPLLHPEE